MYPYGPTTSIRINAMLDFMCMGLTERESSGNRTRSLSHHKLTITFDHLVTLSDAEMCLKIL